MKFEKIKDEALELIGKQNDLSVRICNEIEKLEQNPDINKTKSGFIIRSSDLGKDLNLDPAYYDFKACYKLISAKLGKQNAYDAVIELKNIINREAIMIGGRIFRLHPGLIKNLKTLFDED